MFFMVHLSLFVKAFFCPRWYNMWLPAVKSCPNNAGEVLLLYKQTVGHQRRLRPFCRQAAGFISGKLLFQNLKFFADLNFSKPLYHFPLYHLRLLETGLNMCFFVQQVHKHTTPKTPWSKVWTPNPCRPTWFQHLLFWRAALLVLHQKLNQVFLQTRRYFPNLILLLQATNLATNTNRNLLVLRHLLRLMLWYLLQPNPETT